MKPERGEYYYHFKHDSEKGMNHHLYKIVGISVHSETEEILVTYQPLYELRFLDEKEANFMSRPISMWTDLIETDTYTGLRFVRIEDEQFIAKIKQEFDY